MRLDEAVTGAIEDAFKEQIERTYRRTGRVPLPSVTIEINSGTPAVTCTTRATTRPQDLVAAITGIARMARAWGPMATAMRFFWEQSSLNTMMNTPSPAPSGLAHLLASADGDWDLRWHQCRFLDPLSTPNVQWSEVERAGRTDSLPRPILGLLAAWWQANDGPEDLRHVTDAMREEGYTLRFFGGIEPSAK